MFGAISDDARGLQPIVSLLRATLEETSLEVAIPGSLFQYTHGRIPEK